MRCLSTRVKLKIVFDSVVDALTIGPHKKFNGVKASLAFLVVLMFVEHTFEKQKVRTAKTSGFQKRREKMELFIAVGILFGMGYGAGFGVRALAANRKSTRPRFKPMSSLREFEFREDPVWTR